MSQNKVPSVVKEASDELPHFEDGRIDYTNAKKAPAVVLFLKYEDQILALKRSERVGTCQKRWGTVSGYLDELKAVKEKGIEELEEETGISRDEIDSVKEKGTYQWNSTEEDKVYISFLFLVELDEKPEIKLSWEHDEYKWIKIQEAEKYFPPHAQDELDLIFSSW